MAEIIKVGRYDATNFSSAAYNFLSRGEDAPVLTLLEQGAEVDAVDRFGHMTALHWAVRFDRRTVVRALLNAGADPKRGNKWGITSLMRAKSAEVAHLLLEAGADVNAATIPNKTGVRAGRTALMYAAESGQVEVAALLLEHHAEIHLRDDLGCNALMLAAFSERHEVVQLLLDAGAYVGLVEAALLGDVAQIQKLLAAGADLHPQEMASALRWAAAGGHTDVAAPLLVNGSSIDDADELGRTALIHAVLQGRISMIRLLLERGANPNSPDGAALMASAQSSTTRNREVMELLLAHGAKVNVRSRSGWTSLMLACLWGEVECVELLLRHGADPNIFTDAEIMEREEGCSSTSALMLAVGNVEVVKLLLQYGYDPLARNSADRNALDVARKGIRIGYKQTEIQQILPILEAAAHEQQRP